MHLTHARLLSQFRYDHLPPEMQEYSKPFHDLASHMLSSNFPVELNGPDVTVALRHLLAAKDTFVRSALPDPK